MFLFSSAASLLGNILAAKRINRAGQGIVRAGYGNKKVRKTTAKNKKEFLILPHPNIIPLSLTNFEIQIYYQNESKLMVFFLGIIYLK